MNETWYIEINGQLYGPYLTLQLLQMAQNNQLSLQTPIRSAQNGVCCKVQDVIAMQSSFNSAQSSQPLFPAPVNNSQITQNYSQQPAQSQASIPSVGPLSPQNSAPLTNQAPPAQSVAPSVLPLGQQGFSSVSNQTQPIQSVAPSVLPVGQPMGGAISNQAQIISQNAPSILPMGNISQIGGGAQVINNPQVPTPPMVKPLQEPSTNNVSPVVQRGINSSMRDWIDRSNVENGEIVCPHCWGLCSLETILFISSHPELVGDPLLGGDAATRFLPKYFTAKGTAFDERGLECSDMACPHCHLKIPNSVIDLPSSFFSIVGAPACGKSYFLTAMIWQLRKYLPRFFNFSLFDSDPTFNMVLNNYERMLFLNPEQNEYVSLPKTELQGRDYSNQIIIENNNIDLPRPFVFTLSPQPTHPFYEKHSDELERSIVLYDNAGEHFEPGRDSIANLATVHLVHSDGIIFLYDPLKDIRLRQDCSKSDPQISKNTANITNQMTIFTEMVARIHKYSNMKANEKYDKPLIMVIPKYDAWRESYPLDLEKLDIITYDQNMAPNLNMDVICAVSFCLRKYLLEIAPEIVGLAEGFSKRVYFIPVSALGRMPEFDDGKSLIGIKPENISPIWAEVPFLLQLHLNHLLQAVYWSDDSVPLVEKFRFNHGQIMFAFPENQERHSLPAFYCGKTVYCEESQKYYRLPDYPEKVESIDASSEDDGLLDQEFWNN